MTFITADITKPNQYPASLISKVQKGFDIFYMKGAFVAPKAYPQFLPLLVQSMNQDGWLMTTDKTSTMETFNPEQCLEQNNMTFASYRSEETRVIEELMTPPVHPLSSISTIEMILSRHNRSAGTDLSYWTILNLRKKI